MDYMSSIDIQQKLDAQRQQLISEIVQKYNLIELKCEYLGTDSYYYDKKRRNIYKVSNIVEFDRNINPNFEIVDDDNIRKWNNL